MYKCVKFHTQSKQSNPQKSWNLFHRTNEMKKNFPHTSNNHFTEHALQNSTTLIFFVIRLVFTSDKRTSFNESESIQLKMHLAKSSLTFCMNSRVRVCVREKKKRYALYVAAIMLKQSLFMSVNMPWRNRNLPQHNKQRPSSRLIIIYTLKKMIILKSHKIFLV